MLIARTATGKAKQRNQTTELREGGERKTTTTKKIVAGRKRAPQTSEPSCASPVKRGGTKRKAAEPGPPARGARHGGAEAAAGGEGSSSPAGHLLLSLSEELLGPAAGTSGWRGGWGDAGSTLGSACLRGAGRWDGGSILQGLRETGGVWFVHLCSPARGTGVGSGLFWVPKLQCSGRSPAQPWRQRRDKAELCLCWRCSAASGEAAA